MVNVLSKDSNYKKFLDKYVELPEDDQRIFYGYLLYFKIMQMPFYLRIIEKLMTDNFRFKWLIIMLLKMKKDVFENIQNKFETVLYNNQFDEVEITKIFLIFDLIDDLQYE